MEIMTNLTLMHFCKFGSDITMQTLPGQILTPISYWNVVNADAEDKHDSFKVVNGRRMLKFISVTIYCIF